MSRNLEPLRVKVRFQDPDNLRGRLFETHEYLSGTVVDTVPGPNEKNWVLKLDEPLRTFDVNGEEHTTGYFLLMPDGLDAVAAMGDWPEKRPSAQRFAATVMALKDDTVPFKIERPRDYRRLPMIGALQLIVDAES